MRIRTNNTLKERPVVFGLRDTHVIYVFIGIVIGFALAILSNEIFSLSLLWGLAGTLIIAAALFILMRIVQKRPVDSDLFLDRFIYFRLFQKVKKFSAGYTNNDQFKNRGIWDFLTSFFR